VSGDSGVEEVYRQRTSVTSHSRWVKILGYWTLPTWIFGASGHPRWLLHCILRVASCFGFIESVRAMWIYASLHTGLGVRLIKCTYTVTMAFECALRFQ